MDDTTLPKVLRTFSKVHPNSEAFVLPEEPGIVAIASFTDRTPTEFDLLTCLNALNIREGVTEYVDSKKVDGFPGKLFFFYLQEPALQKRSELLQQVLPYCNRDK
jgi:hypothetical protein